MINSRSSCTIIGLNIDSGDPEWIIDNPAFPTLNSALNLSVVDADNFTYPNGEHAVFITKNSQYDAWRGDNKIVISLFNNNSCADEKGNELVRVIESPPVAYTAAALDSLPTVLAVDLTARTVQRLDQFHILVSEASLLHRYLTWEMIISTSILAPSSPSSSSIPTIILGCRYTILIPGWAIVAVFFPSMNCAR